MDPRFPRITWKTGLSGSTLRGGVTFRNYGEGYELPDNDEGKPETRSGAFTRVNYPMPKVLYDNTCFEFPAYNTNIPDIARVDWFVKDLENYGSAHEGKLPKFVNIAICNDHGADPAPTPAIRTSPATWRIMIWRWDGSWPTFPPSRSGRRWRIRDPG